jgi:hypothetical protein
MDGRQDAPVSAGGGTSSIAVAESYGTCPIADESEPDWARIDADRT